jgi:hypothetical protein
LLISTSFGLQTCHLLEYQRRGDCAFAGFPSANNELATTPSFDRRQGQIAERAESGLSKIESRYPLSSHFSCEQFLIVCLTRDEEGKVPSESRADRRNDPHDSGDS